MDGRLVHLASRLFNTPLAILPSKLQAILQVVGPRLGIREDLIPRADGRFPYHKRDGGEDDSMGPVVGPVATIPVYGTLVKRSGGIDAESGLTSYASLRAKVDAAMKNPRVKSLLFEFDSPGGESSGLFDLCQYLTSLRGSKPMIGIANDSSYSASYAVASCMDKLFVTGVGGVGSIGVYMLHVDKSKYDEKQGISYSFIKSGARKTDGNQHEPLSDRARADLQAEVDRIAEMFVQLVAANRKIDPKKIRDTEAGTFMGSAACPMFADCVETFDGAMAYATALAGGANADVLAARARLNRLKASAATPEELAARARFDRLKRSF